VDVIYGGETGTDGAQAGETPNDKKAAALTNGVNKRKAANISGEPSPAESRTPEKPLSKNEMKRRAKKARLEGRDNTNAAQPEQAPTAMAMPILHETVVQKQKKP